MSGGLAGLVALTGCVVAPPPVVYQPPPVQQQAPFVAVPGPGKTAALFQRDDVACRNAPPPRVTASSGAAGQTTTAQGLPEGYTPGVGYLQCMEARNNLIEPLAVSTPPQVYAYLPSYPVYVGPWYGYGYPWYYGSVGFGFGYYGGFGYGRYGYGYGRGFGGYGRGYGGGYGGGFRGGYGGGGFGGGGFRGGGGGGGFGGGGGGGHGGR